MKSKQAFPLPSASQSVRLMRRTVFSVAFAAVFTCVSALNAAFGEVIEVTASGKDYPTAVINARVSAVRQLMLEMTSSEFQKSHVRQLRELIAAASAYSSEPKVSSSDHGDRLLEVTASVDVDTEKLARKLQELGAKVTRSYRSVLAGRTEAAAKSLTAFFGPEAKLSVHSQKTPARFNPAPVTASEDGGSRLSGPDGISSFQPGEEFPVSYIKGAADEGKTGYIVMVEAGLAPCSYKEAFEVRRNNYEYKIGDPKGLTVFRTPVNPGSYELRFYPDKDAAAHTASYGFQSKDTGVPVFSIERSVFAPGERIYVHLDYIKGYENFKFYVVRPEQAAIKYDGFNSLSQSDDLGRSGTLNPSLKAPNEAGDYALILMQCNCDKDSGCSADNGFRRDSAVSSLTFSVAEPKTPPEPMLMVPPELPSGGELNVVAGWPADPGRAPYVSICPLDAAPDAEPIRNLYDYSANPGAAVRDAMAVFEPGDFRAELRIRKDNGYDILAKTEFRVLPAPGQARPALVPERQIYQPGETLSFSFSARSDWHEQAFVVLVPTGTAAEAKAAYEAAAGNCRMELRHQAHSSAVMWFLDVEPGTYELRMYDRRDDSAKLVASSQVKVAVSEDARQHRQELESLLDEALLGMRHSLPAGSSSPGADSVVDRSVMSPGVYTSAAGQTYRLISSIPAEERQRLDADVKFRRTANFGKACSDSIDKRIREYTRMDLTLGRDNHLQEELLEFGKSMLLEWPNGLEKMQTAAKIANDTISHGIAGLDALSEDNYAAAAKEAGLYMIKTALNACSGKDCYLSLVGANRDTAAAYFGSMSEKEFLASARRIIKAADNHPHKERFFILAGQARARLNALRASHHKLLESAEDLEALHDGLDKLIGAGEAAAGAEADSGAQSFISLDNGVVRTNTAGAVTLAVSEALCRANPKCAMLVSSAKLAYQTRLAVRDFARDSSVLAAYTDWQKFSGTHQEWLIKQGGVRGLGNIGRGELIKQVRSVMSKTWQNSSMTESSLSPEHKKLLKTRRTCLAEKLDPAYCNSLTIGENEFSDTEVWNYLQAQFQVWDDEETGKIQKSREAEALKSDFERMNSVCRSNLDFYIAAHKERVGAGTKLLNSVKGWFSSDPCKETLEAFDEFVRMRSELEGTLRQVLPPDGKPCWWSSRSTMKSEIDDTMCKALKDFRSGFTFERTKEKHAEMVGSLDAAFRQQIMNDVADRACECGVSMSVVDGKLYQAGLEPADRMAGIADKTREALEQEQTRDERRAKLLEKIRGYSSPDDISLVMNHIGKAGVLNCLCRLGPGGPAFGGGSVWVGGGKCRSWGPSGWGNWESHMSTKEADKIGCGYYDNLEKYLQHKTGNEKLEALTTPQDMRQKVINADPFLTIRGQKGCRVKN